MYEKWEGVPCGYMWIRGASKVRIVWNTSKFEIFLSGKARAFRKAQFTRLVNEHLRKAITQHERKRSILRNKKPGLRVRASFTIGGP
jgi:hypothetical protein